MTRVPIHTFAGLDAAQGGAITAALDELLASAVEDCEERPKVGKTREVSLTIIYKPLDDEEGSVRADWHCKSKPAPDEKMSGISIVGRRARPGAPLTARADDPEGHDAPGQTYLIEGDK